MLPIRSLVPALALFLVTPILAATPALLPVAPGMQSKRGAQVPNAASAVRFNARAVHAAGTGAVTLALPDGQNYALTFDRFEQHTPQIASWQGYLAEHGRDYTVHATTGPTGTYGHLRLPDGEFMIVPGDGHDWLVDASSLKVRPPKPGTTDQRIPPFDAAGRVRAKADPVCADVPSMPTPNVTVDVLFVLAPDFVAIHGGTAGAQTRLNNLVSAVNAYYRDSNVAITLRMVGSMNVDYPAPDSVDDGTALDAISEGTRGVGIAPFVGVAAQRNAVGADIVVLMRGQVGSCSSGCGISGIAWVGGGGQRDIANSTAFMYAVAGDGPTFTASLLAHEIGHNFGNVHDPANDGNGAGASGVTTYSRGYILCGAGASTGCGTTQGFPNTGTGFKTIMAYGRPDALKFSSPHLSCRGSTNGITAPCGVAVGQPGNADTVRSMNCVRTKLAAMKPTVIPSCTNPTLDTDADGIPDCTEATEGRNASVKDNDVFGNTRLFVMQQFRDFLGREGDAGGISFWSAEIAAARQDRASMIEQFLRSAEFEARVAPIARLYFATYRRTPDYSGLIFWSGQFAAGTPLDSIAASFAQAPEFVATYGNLSNRAFVERLYLNVLGRPGDAAGIDFWTGQIDSGARSRGAVLAQFSESAEFRAAIGRSVDVTMIYVGMLRRAPDSGGFTFWVGQLATRSVRDLIGSFLPTAEYRARFLP
jgi:hypothetical protein